MSRFEIPIRYFPHSINYDDLKAESELEHVERLVDFDTDLSAFIIVDAWNTNEISFERIERIARERIKPVVDACRMTGIMVVHAPSPPVADKYPDRRFKPSEKKAMETPDWPTREMLWRTGPYRKYSLSGDPDAPFLSQERLYANYVINPLLGPEGDDVVVGDAGELHALLAERKKFHLFYAGFASNGCIQERDYGVKGMLNNYGYNVILLRDCTTATEMAHTLASLEQTRASIDNMEMWIATTASDDFINALA